MKTTRLRIESGALVIDGAIRIQGLNPDRVVVVIRKLFDIDIGTIWEAENTITNDTTRATTFMALAKTVDEWLEDD